MSLKTVLVYGYGAIRYYMTTLNWRLERHNIGILSLEKTLQCVKEGDSLVRLGDGEMLMIEGGEIWFQSQNKELGEFLKRLLQKKELPKNLLVAIPGMVFSMADYNRSTKCFWYRELIKTHQVWLQNLREGSIYGNVFVSRPFTDLKNQRLTKKVFDYWREQIFAGRNIIVVEGETACTGIKNDLFKKSKSVKRIICPAHNAYDYYDEILKSTLSAAKKDDLILCVLGPTAKPLVFELAQKGYWAVDIGHLGQEYAFYYHKVPKAKAQEGYQLDNHATSDKLYKSQIIAKIGSKDEPKSRS